MQMEQRAEQTQKLILTHAMQQSLQCLQKPALELREYLQEEALSNPLLEVEEPSLSELSPEMLEPDRDGPADLPVERREQLVWESGRRTEGGDVDFTAYCSRTESFPEYLENQLGQMTHLDGEQLALCRYLVGCLNSAGYLDCPLEELAGELGCPVFDLEQALFVVQSLDPPGVGARSLTECLLLQLAQSRSFNAVNIHLIREGLPLLAKGDYAALARLLGVRQSEARAAGDAIRALNPIPSCGFSGGSSVPYILPEASIRCDGGRVVIEMNDQAMPRLSLNGDYCVLLEGADCPADARPYLREKLGEAKGLMANLRNRQDTLFRLLSEVVRMQEGYFLRGEELRPMTMGQAAEALGLNISTVSRAVKEKYVQFDGRVFPLRSLFTASVQATDGGSVSAESARQQLRRFLEAEDPAAPLSDEALSAALASVGIALSRRTVAKYRAELDIPAASQRRRQRRP